MEFDGFFGRTALLVDRSGELTSALRPALEARGFELCAMDSAVEALAIAVAAHFDAVICDLNGAGLSLSAFETALERARPGLAKRCLFIAPASCEETGSGQALVCRRPLNLPEILRMALFLAADPLAETDAILLE